MQPRDHIPYSFRKRRREVGETPNPLSYEIPDGQFRRQLLFHLRECIGIVPNSGSARADGQLELPDQIWNQLNEFLDRYVDDYHYSEYMTIAEDFVARFDGLNTDQVLDVVEYAFLLISHYYSDDYVDMYADARRICHTREAGVALLNQLFSSFNIGFQLLDGQIIQQTSQYIHAEIVEQTVSLLHKHDFQSANQEFMKAHEHFRAEDYEDTITNASKSLESTMKLICKKRGYPYDSKRDTLGVLVKILRANGYFPVYSEEFTNNLLKVLETSGSMIRNKQGAHGKADDREEADRSLAAYALHMTASNIVFLVERYDALSN